VPAGQTPAVRQRQPDMAKKLLWLQQAPPADQTRGHAAFRRAKQHHPALGQGLEVGLGGRVLIHAGVHGWGHEQRAVHGQRRDGQQIIGQAMRQPGNDIGRGRRNHQQVGVLGQGHMGDMGFAAGGPQVGVCWPAGDRLEGEGRDKARGRLGQHHVHPRAGLGKLAGQVGGFIGGNGTSDAQHQVLIGKQGDGRHTLRM